MATLTGSPYSRSSPGCVYLVPVHATIATQAHYFKVHVSHHLVAKQLIAGGDHVKGTHLSPDVRKKQNPALRKKQNPALRKKPDQPGWTRRGGNNKQSDADILQDIQLRFETHGGEGFASPQKVILLCGNKTKFFIKNAKLGLCIRGVNPAKRKRWRDLPCF